MRRDPGLSCVSPPPQQDEQPSPNGGRQGPRPGQASSQTSPGLGWRPRGGPAGGGRAWEGCKLVWGGRAFLPLPVAPAFVLMCH